VNPDAMSGSAVDRDPRGDARGFQDLAALVEVGTAAAPRGLLTAAARARLATVPAVLPSAFEIGAFECHLGAAAGRVDFEACVRRAGGGRDVLAAGIAGPAGDRLAALDDGWRRTIAFLRAWCDPRSPLHDGIDVAWIEMDLDADRLASPFVVFTLARDRDERAPYTARHGRALREGLRLLAGGVDDRVMAAVDHAVGALAPTGMLLHAGVRPLASGPVVRLVARLPRPLMPDYLARIGWPGSETELAAVLHRLCPTTVLHALNLDVGAAIGPRLGIEYHFRTSPADDPRWASVFDGLVAAGACSPAERALLACWRPPGSIAPGAPMRELLVKVVYETGRALGAKAYLPFTATPWRG
jgi:hypothetical protein